MGLGFRGFGGELWFLYTGSGDIDVLLHGLDRFPVLYHG